MQAQLPASHQALTYSVDEAARLLGYNRTGVYRLIAEGELSSLKLGRCRRIPADALEDLIERKTEEAR